MVLGPLASQIIKREKPQNCFILLSLLLLKIEVQLRLYDRPSLMLGRGLFSQIPPRANSNKMIFGLIMMILTPEFVVDEGEKML